MMFNFIILSMIFILIGVYLGMVVRFREENLPMSKAILTPLIIFLFPLISIIMLSFMLTEQKLSKEIDRMAKEKNHSLSNVEKERILKDMTSLKTKFFLFRDALIKFLNFRDVTTSIVEFLKYDLKQEKRVKDEVQTFNKTVVAKESNRQIHNLLETRLSTC